MSAQEGLSTFAPFKVSTFRSMWIASMLSNFGGMVQAVGAAWLMTKLTASADLVALVQASTTLPVMLFALLAGAIADNYDRRLVMLCAQIFMFTVSAVLAAVAYFDWINEWSLLGLTFLIGCGMAFNIPAWQASVRDIVGTKLLTGAVLLNGVGFNVTRSVAPAAGGAIVASAGAVAAFFINALSYLGLIGVVWRWSGPDVKAPEHRESLLPAVQAGVRYVAWSPNLSRIMIRGFIFGLCTVVVLALLPLVASDQLNGTAVTFGLLLCAFGIGAVLAGLSSERIRRHLNNEQLVRANFVMFAIAAVTIAHSTVTAVTALAVALAGAAWVLSLALFNTSVQMSTPRWVVGRALSLYQMATFGGMAIGSWIWGLTTDTWSLSVAFQVAAVCMLVGAAWGLAFPLPGRDETNLEPLNRWQAPPVGVDILPRSGPIAVLVEYQIQASDVREFHDLMLERRRLRRRDGAVQWTLMRDLNQLDRWYERFELPTWADYVRFHDRTTQEDGKVGERIRAMHQGEERPKVQRYLVRDPARPDPQAIASEPADIR